MTLDPELVDRVRSRLLASGAEPTAAAVALALRREGALLGDEVVLAVVGHLRGELVGAGLLEPLLADPEVTDVLVNGPDDVWVERAGILEPAGVSLGTETDVRRLAQRLAVRAGRRLDDSAPWVDARLPDGVRLHAVLPPVAPGGTVVSLRVPSRVRLTLADLVVDGLPGAVAGVLEAVVRSRLAFLVSGGTGAGKTTLLSALLGLADPRERLVLVEDTGELAPEHPHVVRLEARVANVEGAGAVGLRDLVRQALRMRPDRVVLGEVRGAEVLDLLVALNTGHEGGSSTVHANAAAGVPARVVALGLMGGIDADAVSALLVAGVDAVVHVSRGRDGRRRVAEIGLLRADGARAVVVEALRVDPDGSVVPGPAWPELRRRCGLEGWASL
jgi:pilus assembly protein CpaF